MTDRKIVDCRGLACPQPVLDTRSALDGATAPIEVIVDNEGSSTNVRRYAEGRGARVSVERRDGDYHVTIDLGDGTPDARKAPAVCNVPVTGGTAVLVSSEFLGRGDDELGGVLMEAFLDTLSQFRDEISHCIFVNTGAKLAVEGSRTLGQVRQLADVGVEILVCGTCLNHFGLEDDLAVGRVSNMYEIIETLTAAGRVLRP